MTAIMHLRGSMQACASQYGELYAEDMRIFLDIAVRPDAQKRRYANACISHTRRDAASAFTFMKAAAKGAGLLLEDLMLLALHEELYHEPHCSGFVVNAADTIIGQNWDWTPSWKRYLSLLSMDARGTPKTISCSYPGLWKSMWMNEYGAAILWTGAGYFPPLRPRAGVPTYALLAEASRYRTTEGITQYLSRVRNAGSFILLVADGRHGVAYEAANQVHAVQESPLLIRTNHFELAKTRAASRQRVPGDMCTIPRNKALHDYLDALDDIDAHDARNALSQDRVYTPHDSEFATHASVISLPAQHMFSIRIGGSSRWEIYTL